MCFTLLRYKAQTQTLAKSDFQKARSRRRLCHQYLRRSARFSCLKLKRLRGRPDEIARGVAVGAFTGVMPLFGVQSIIAIALAALVRGNPLAAATATWISNPVTFIPLYTLNFRLGQQILGTQDLFLILSAAPSFSQFLMMGIDCILTLTIGCVALGIPTAVLSYLLTLKFVRYRRHRKALNRHRGHFSRS